MIASRQTFFFNRTDKESEFLEQNTVKKIIAHENKNEITKGANTKNIHLRKMQKPKTKPKGKVKRSTDKVNPTHKKYLIE